MSIKVSSLIWDLRGLSPMQKLVLVKLADHAKDDGTDVRPGQKTVAGDCECSVRTVQRVVEWACDEGILIEEDGPGNKVRRYHFDIRLLRQRVTLTESHPDRESTREGDTQSGSGRHTVGVRATHSQAINKNHPGTINEPSVCLTDQPDDPLADQVLSILHEVPGIGRSDPDRTHWAQNTARVREVLNDFPQIQDDDWLEVAKECRDTVENHQSMRRNSNFNKPASTCLREFVNKSIRPRLQVQKPVSVMQSMSDEADAYFAKQGAGLG